jgi:hypothetical protein
MWFLDMEILPPVSSDWIPQLAERYRQRKVARGANYNRNNWKVENMQG